MAKVLLFAGKSRSGKDTACDFLKSYDYKKVAFANKIKDDCMNLYNFSYDQMYGNLKDIIDPRFNQTPRYFLQSLGEYNRGLYLNVWADYLFNVTINNLIKNGHNRICISDGRHQSEIEFAYKWAEENKIKLLTIKIVRPEIEALSGSDHISEKDLDNFDDVDMTIINKEKEEFNKKVLTLI